jgi:hypothetical protein
MSTFWQTFFASIAGPLAILAGSAVSLFFALGARWAYAHTKSEQIKATILRLNDAVNVGVREVQQTVVNTLKATTADGKLSEEDAKAVRAAALATIEKHFGGAGGLASVAKTLGVDDMVGVLNARIEAAVQQTRAATEASAQAPAPVAIAVSK